VSSFTSKQLRVTLILENTNAHFPNTNSNTLVLTDLRMIAFIEGVARLATTAEIRLYGLLPADMNALTVVFFNPGGGVLNQIVIVEANDGTGWFQVFSGTMIEAQPDYRGAPDVFFHIQARIGYFAQINPVPPASYTGATDVAGICASLAKQMGFAFENNGVKVKVSNPYLSGTAFDQLTTICAAANVDFYFIPNATPGAPGTLAITPGGGVRPNVPVVVLQQGSGLVGYPVLERFGLTVECLWNSGITGGGPVKVESDLPPANGLWSPFMLRHALSCNLPDGPWFSQLSCYPVPP
jgi:hypothetical protein